MSNNALTDHETAGIFPMMDDDTFGSLVANIRRNGLRHPIVLHPDGSILDGRNRYKACQEADMPIRTVKYDGALDVDSLIDYVWSTNVERRHLTSSQKACCAADAEKMREAEAAAAEKRMKAGKKDPTQQIVQGPRQDRSTDAKVAGRFGTNPDYVRRARNLKDEDPERFQAVRSGEKTLTQVDRERREAKREERREENRQKVEACGDPLAAGVKFATIVIDPPWDWRDEGDVDQLGRARPTYDTMSIEQLLEYPIPDLADVDCHLYLWITNRSLPKGFVLIERLGFRYVTCLTWCKPSFGMGNYYRGSTEHLLFAVCGSQALKRKDVGTWLEAPRPPGAGHSGKPDAAYSMIESCSPGPYIDIFARRERHGWTTHGAEVCTTGAGR